MAERVQQPLAPTSSDGERQPDERAPARPGPDLQEFLRLLGALAGKTPAERQRLAAGIIDMVIAMRAPGNDRAEAVAILKQLELDSLTLLFDASGRNARKEAVETLMAMGFPYALSISPEDFEFARGFVNRARRAASSDEAEAEAEEDEPPWKTRMRASRKVCASIAITGNLLQLPLLAASVHPPGLLVFGVIAALIGIGAALWLNALEPDPDNQSLPLTTLVVGAVLNLAVAALSQSFAAVVGFLACAIGVAVATSWQNTEPRRRW